MKLLKQLIRQVFCLHYWEEARKFGIVHFRIGERLWICTYCDKRTRMIKDWLPSLRKWGLI